MAIVFTFIAVGQAGFNQALDEYKPNLIQGDIIVRDGSTRAYYGYYDKITITDPIFNASGFVDGQVYNILETCRSVDFVFDGPNRDLCPTCHSKCLTDDMKRDSEMGCSFNTRTTCTIVNIQKCIIDQLKAQRTISGVTRVQQTCLDLQVATLNSVFEIPGYVPSAGITTVFVILSIIAFVKGIVYNCTALCLLYFECFEFTHNDKCCCGLGIIANKTLWRWDEPPLRWFRSDEIHPIQGTTSTDTSAPNPETNNNQGKGIMSVSAEATTTATATATATATTTIPVREQPDPVEISTETMRTLFPHNYHHQFHGSYCFTDAFRYFLKMPHRFRSIPSGENTECRISPAKIQNVYYHCPYCDENINLHSLISKLRLYNNLIYKIKTGNSAEPTPCCNVLTPLPQIHEDLYILP